MKLKSKWIKDLKVKSDTLNPVKEKEYNSLELFSTGDDFLNRTPIACSLRTIINKWNLVKWKSFCKAKDTINRTKWQPIKWERFSQTPLSTGRQYLKHIKNSRN